MTTFLLLAMNRVCTSDVQRIKELQRKGNVITVSESTVPDKGKHQDVDFRCPRGWRVVARISRRLVKEKQRVIVILDYFWLERGYFKARYGLDWIEYKVPLLLAAGVSQVILPNSSDIVTSDTAKKYAKAARFNPLFLATRRSGIPSNRGKHSTHLARLSSPPFLVFRNNHVRFSPLSLMHMYFLSLMRFSPLSLMHIIDYPLQQ